MMKHLKLFAVLLVICTGCEGSSSDEESASALLEAINELELRAVAKLSEAGWNYASNLTTENGEKEKVELANYAKFTKFTLSQLNLFDWRNFQNKTLRRMFKIKTDIGDSVLIEEDFSDLNAILSEMKLVFATAKVPSFSPYDDGKLLSLEPEISEIIETSRNPQELAYYWTKWHDNAGTPNKENFFRYVNLRNKAAKLNNFKSGAEVWLDAYEDPTFEAQIEKIVRQLQPLYQQLHGYVRFKLHEHYGPAFVDLSKPLPIHLLGNMWGQKWEIDDIVIPYRNKPTVDVTAEMLRQKFTPRKMFDMAENFFTSLNLTKMPATFWTKSIIEKPNDGREMVCHASAWDMSIKDDVRIKQCTRVTMDNLIVVHHEMGHVEYYLQYHNQPLVFRAGANPGFHEAIGDVIALSVATNRHLQRVGLLKDFHSDQETEINALMRMATLKIAFLPFAFAMDKFRWEVFRGNVKPDKANCYFWELREKYCGVEPANVRTNRDFDITAKYHASADVEYLRYFVSFIIQFQFHKAACIKAGEYEPNNPSKTLKDCDIYQSVEAGNALKSMLAMGASRPWPDAMEAMTGQRELDASALLEYFKPLEDWLVQTNAKLGVPIGWQQSDKIDCSI